MLKKHLFPIFVLFLVSCGKSTPMPTSTIEITNTPSKIPHLENKIIDILMNNDFERDKVIDDTCDTQCKGYASTKISVFFLIYEDGTVGIKAEYPDLHDTSILHLPNSSELVYSILKQIYSSAICDYIKNHWEGASKTEQQETIENYIINMKYGKFYANKVLSILIIPN